MIRLGSVLLYVRDLIVSRKYYEALLERAFVQYGEQAAILDAGGCELILLQEPEIFTGDLTGLESEKIRGKGIVVHFAVDDVDTHYSRLQSCGIAVSLAPTSQSFGRRQMYLYDPDGYNVVMESRIEPK